MEDMDLLTMSELQDYLKVSRQTIYRLLALGLPGIKVGRQRRFDRRKVDEWLADQQLSDQQELDVHD